jgi:hypothetical protein
MNTQQQKALRLAKELVSVHQGHADEGPSTFSESAAELRRLHSVNAELLESLKLLHLHLTTPIALQMSRADLVKKARAAIAKAQE